MPCPQGISVPKEFAKQFVRRTIRRGYRFVCDVDLSKAFDRVQHDDLMSRVSRRVNDNPLLKLIGLYLLIFVEPPDADPHVRWCGEGVPKGASLPDFVFACDLIT